MEGVVPGDGGIGGGDSGGKVAAVQELGDLQHTHAALALGCDDGIGIGGGQVDPGGGLVLVHGHVHGAAHRRGLLGGHTAIHHQGGQGGVGTGAVDVHRVAGVSAAGAVVVDGKGEVVLIAQAVEVPAVVSAAVSAIGIDVDAPVTILGLDLHASAVVQSHGVIGREGMDLQLAAGGAALQGEPHPAVIVKLVAVAVEGHGAGRVLSGVTDHGQVGGSADSVVGIGVDVDRDGGAGGARVQMQLHIPDGRGKGLDPVVTDLDHGSGIVGSHIQPDPLGIADHGVLVVASVGAQSLAVHHEAAEAGAAPDQIEGVLLLDLLALIGSGDREVLFGHIGVGAEGTGGGDIQGLLPVMEGDGVLHRGGLVRHGDHPDSAPVSTHLHQGGIAHLAAQADGADLNAVDTHVIGGVVIQGHPVGGLILAVGLLDGLGVRSGLQKGPDVGLAVHRDGLAVALQVGQSLGRQDGDEVVVLAQLGHGHVLKHAAAPLDIHHVAVAVP